VNCTVLPTKVEGFTGATAMEVSVGGTRTVSVVVPVTPLMVAEIVAPPAETAVAKPAALIVAMPVFDEVHVTWPVRFCVLLSEYVPIAVNCTVLPIRLEGFTGATAMEVSVGGTRTVSVVVPVTLLIAAEIVAPPAETAVAKPAALMVAMPVFDEVHVTWLVRSCVLLSEYVPVAVNCCVAPTDRVGFAGVTAIDVKVGGGAALPTA